jgi:hypothetical protein
LSSSTAGLSPDEKALVLLAALRDVALAHARSALLLLVALVMLSASLASPHAQLTACRNASTFVATNLAFFSCITFTVLVVHRML